MTIHQIIREIYRGSTFLPIESFQAFALETVRQTLSFDSAFWASGETAPNSLHSMHITNRENELRKIYETGCQDHDLMCRFALSTPGKAVLVTDLIDRPGFEALPYYATLYKPLGIEQQLAISFKEDHTGLYEFVALWRADKSNPFQEADRSLMQDLMPHLVAAWTQACTFQVRPNIIKTSSLGPIWSSDRGLTNNEFFAVVDVKGTIYTVEEGFAKFIKEAYPEWEGAKLPATLVDDCFQGGTRSTQSNIEHRGLVIRIQRIGSQYRLAIRGGRGAFKLTPKEAQVAELYSKGKTYKVIAKELASSPATVRNQIASVFAKVGVGNKAELVRRLEQSPSI